MWFILNNNLIGKNILLDDSCHIYVSDFTHVWHKILTDNELLSISKKLNPLFEAPIPKLKEIISGLFDSKENIKKEIKNEFNNIAITLESAGMGIKFYFHVTLSRGDEKLLFNEFIQPLLLTLIDLKNTEKQLLRVIEQRNREIEECKGLYMANENNLITNHSDLKNIQSLIPETSNMKCSGRELLNCISSNLSFIKKRLEKQQTLSNIEGEFSNCNEQLKANQTIIKQEHSCSSNFQQGINFNHQTIKKRKKEIRFF